VRFAVACDPLAEVTAHSLRWHYELFRFLDEHVKKANAGQP
jgi:hypothetical protein